MWAGEKTNFGVLKKQITIEKVYIDGSHENFVKILIDICADNIPKYTLRSTYISFLRIVLQSRSAIGPLNLIKTTRST